ncbi:MAG TPA: DMT family transporter, partial [Burkholderiaceae bacterium]|nr:DMT family transporter [Burkholderiaceae bacterium]
MSAPATRAWPGVALATAGAIAFSGKAILAKLMYRHGVDAVQVLFWRMLLSLPLFLALAWWAGRGKPALTRQDWLALIGLGFCGYYLASMLDFMGLMYVTASLERLILYLNPTLVLLLSMAVLRVRVSPRQGAAIALSYAGVLVVFGQELRFEGANVALGSALVFGS